jgi:hypothetical protein
VTENWAASFPSRQKLNAVCAASVFYMKKMINKNYDLILILLKKKSKRMILRSKEAKKRIPWSRFGGGQ